jgi:hypothetical protein
MQTKNDFATTFFRAKTKLSLYLHSLLLYNKNSKKQTRRTRTEEC